MNNNSRSCLGLLLGINTGRNKSPQEESRFTGTEDPGRASGGMSEGDIHSGPGGYEGMGYSGGYAADYYGDDEGGER